jgi:phage terminase large subunit-like protein
VAGIKANRQKSLRSFLSFCEGAGFEPEAFQKKIAGAFFGPETEFLALLPRGQGKSRLAGALAVHHLTTVPTARVYVAAASREQASVVHEYARDFARAIDPQIDVNQREIRTETGYLRIVASDAGKLQGLTPSLVVVDELHAHKDAAVYLAMRTALLKRPGAKMAVISTAGQGMTSPLGQLRARALAGDVHRHGAVTDARAETLRMLEWMVGDEVDLDDYRAAKQANPASWLTRRGLREQREALPELAYRRYHLNQWTGRFGSWLPAGAWQSCANGVRPAEGSKVWVGVDVGGARADTAIVWIDEQGAIDCRIWSGDDALMDATEFLPALAQRFRIVEIAFDPWRAQMLAKVAEQHGIKITAFPQSDNRMIPASAALHQAIVEGKLHHPDDPKLNEHVAAAVAKHGRRGWRIDQAERGTNIDGLIALVMAYEAFTAPQPPPTRVLGWL